MHAFKNTSSTHDLWHKPTHFGVIFKMKGNKFYPRQQELRHAYFRQGIIIILTTNPCVGRYAVVASAHGVLASVDR